MRINDLYENFKKLKIEELQSDSIEASRATIIDTITDDQMYNKGIDGTGQSLGQYRPKTITIKKAKGQRTDHITLRDTRDFHSGFTMDKTSYGFEVYSKDSKAGMLEKNYGGAIFDLTKENKAIIIQDEILPKFLKDLKESVQL